MSSVKLTLRQPPNVDYVQGFPGIPAGANRPHASVKGVVEVRVGPGPPVKAKYIKVELRKIETLPGGGPTNTFTGVVGTGSFNVWTAKDEWEVVKTDDIPFNIRIPENVPPTVHVENGGGIQYELAAEICIKTKKGLFRKEVSPLRETTAKITIDKHELHSTWPVYLKPDVRNMQKNGFDLTVERHNTCYGPGDVVNVKAILKSLTGTGTVRVYEMALRETAVYRQFPGTTGPKGASGPVVRSNFIGTNKLPVRVVIRPGLSDSIDLKCTIPSTHKTTTVVTAEHIEIVYSLAVRTILEDKTELVIDNIPIMMSNWPRQVSETTVQTIGYAPHLSLDQAPQPRPSTDTAASPRPLSTVSTLPGHRQQRPYSIAEKVGGGGSNTLPANGNNAGPVDEFGRPGMGTVSVIPEESETSDVAGNGSSNPDVTKASGRTQNRYTIVNADDSIEQKPYLSALEEKNQLKANLADDELRPSGSSSGASGSGPGPAGGGRQLKKGWLNAEQEKMKQQQQSKRYEEAKRVAVATQEAAKAELEATGQPVPESGTVMIPSSATPEPSSVISPSPGPVSVPLHTPSPAPAVSPGPQLQSVLQSPAPAQTPVLAPAPQASSQGSSPAPSTQPHWPTAEEEKHRRLFNEAQDRARRAQAAALLQTSSPSPSPLSQANVAALENAYQPPNAVQSPMAGPAPVATPPAPSPPPAAMYVPAPAAQPAAMYVPTPAAQPAAMYAPNTVPPPAAMYAPAPAPIPAPVPAPAPVVAPAPIPTPPVMFQPSPQPAPAALPPAMNVIRQDPGRITPQQQAPGFKRSAGAELYQNAMMMARGAPGQSPSKPALQNVIRPAQSSSPTPSANAAVMGGPVPAASGQQQWQGGYPGAVPQQNFVNAGGSSSGVPSSRRPQLSAEAEKAQLRYLEAKRAVDRRQRDEAGPEQSDPNAAGPAPTQPPQNAPLPYEMLFPGAANGPATAPVQQVPMQQPPMQMRSPVQPQSAPPIGMVASNAPMNPAVGMHRRTMSNGSSMSASEDGVRRQMNPLEAIASLSRNTEGGSAPSPPPRRQTPGIMSPMSPMATGNTFSGSSGFAPSPRPPSYNPPPGAAGGSGFTSPQQPPVRDAYRPPQAPLTAEQEKAQLAARYRQANESPMGGGSSSSQPAPPPPAQGSPPPFDAMPPSVPGGAPAYGGGTSALSATEEKARLAAAYAAEERGTQNANQTPGYGAPPPADAYGYQAPPPVGQFPPAAEWNTPPPMSPPQQTQQMYQSPPPQAYAQLPPQQQQQQQYPAQAPYSQPQPPYGQPQALYQGMHAAQPQIGAGTPSPPIAAPQATRPAMPTNFESQGSMGGGSVSNGYANAQSPAPTGGYQQPQYQQSPPQQYESGYLYQDQQTNPANGNGNGYHEQQPYPQNGNGVNNGWSDPSSYGQYPQQQQQYPSSALDRDPAVRQGKQRASQLLPQQQYDYYPHDEHDPDATFVPPPLAPRPPAEYIQETQRVAAATDNHRWEEENMMHYDPNALGGGLGTAGSQGSQFGLEVRPFSPLDLSFDRPPPPPPPPRVHI